MKETIYLDHNATAPLSARARQVWLEAQDRFLGNPASLHRVGQRAERALEEARERLAVFLKAGADSLVWTSGATEGANAVLAHWGAIAEAEQGVWVASGEHPCVAEAAERWFPGRVKWLPLTADGRLEWDALEKLQEERPVGVCLQAANNETGVLQPWREVAQQCRALGVPVLCDATQWMGRLAGAGLGGVDYVIGSAHKCGGPVGVGFLKVKTGAFRAWTVGGGHEEGRRAGTQNVAGVLAMAEAFAEGEERQREVEGRLAERRVWEEALKREIPGSRILGENVERLWNTVSVLLPELEDCRNRWVVRLDAAGVAGSTGAACAGGSARASRGLRAMGIFPEAADRSLRLSGGWDSTRVEWETAREALVEIHRRHGATPVRIPGKTA